MDVNQIFFVGHNKYGQAGIGQDQHNKKYQKPKQIIFKTFIKQVSCGNHHSALLTIDGLIYTMGSNIHGTLGLGNAGNINYAFKPTLVKELKNVDQVASGSYHMCALKQGELYTWGKGIDGQLGHGNMKNVFVPTKVQSLGNIVESMSCGMNHTLVVLGKAVNDMNGYAFGSGIYGQLGCGSNRSYNYPINIKLPKIEFVSAGQNHSLFLSQSEIYGCGDNSCFQISNFDESSLKNKKYVLEPAKLDFFLREQINFIDCHNFSVALASDNKAYVWGGKQKIWPPVQVNEEQVVNLKVTNDKLFCINRNNELFSVCFKNGPGFQQEKQILLTNKNLLDFDAGEHHLLAVGDIVAQINEKQEASCLSIWTGESLRSSKQIFSQKSLNTKNLQREFQQSEVPINQNMHEFFFTKHLKSGMSEQESLQSSSQVAQGKPEQFRSREFSLEQSYQYQPSNQTSNTSQNMSSQIQIESRPRLQINESQTKKYFDDKCFAKNQVSNQESIPKAGPFKIQSDLIVSENKNISETKLQKLMDEMELKTVHLKKNYPIEEKQYQEKKIIKTPSSYIKKEPENFVLESGQFYNERNINHGPQVSNFEDTLQMIMPLKQINLQNQLLDRNQQKEHLKPKSRAKSIIYYKEKQNFFEEEQQVSGFFQEPNEVTKKEENSCIENIFMQLLRKQLKEKASNQKIPKVHLSKDSQELPQRRKQLSHSCIESKSTAPSTQRPPQAQDLPKLVPMTILTRTPVNQNKMAVSNISQRSNISGKSNFKKNPDLVQISRSNRQLRFELRDRDLKISNLQEELSKKQIELEMLYKQLEYFSNMSLVCKQCGVQNTFEDPFASV